MAVRVIEKQANVIEVFAEGKLTQQNYEELAPRFERLIERYGKLRILFVMENFHGWTAGALWEDLKVDLKHFNDVERIAFVGDKKWEKGMATFCKPFTSAEVRFFEPHEIDQARDWVAEGAQAAA
jgi:hypothetical protein